MFCLLRGRQAQEYLSVVNLSTRHSAPIACGCGSELSSAAHINRLDQTALNCVCHVHLLRHIDLRAIRPVLLAIDLDVFIASIPVRTSFRTMELQNKANVACNLETHRGLTAYEEAAPLGEAFGDDE